MPKRTAALFRIGTPQPDSPDEILYFQQVNRWKLSCTSQGMSIWLILFLVQVTASVYAFARQPKQDRCWGAYAVRKAE